MLSKLVAWVRDLNAVIKRYRLELKLKEHERFTLLLMYDGGDIRSVSANAIYDEFELPRVIAQVVSGGDFPNIPKMDRFVLEHISHSGRVAAYKQDNTGDVK